MDLVWTHRHLCDELWTLDLCGLCMMDFVIYVMDFVCICMIYVMNFVIYVMHELCCQLNFVKWREKRLNVQKKSLSLCQVPDQ